MSLQLPKERDFYFSTGFNSETVKELIEGINEVNKHDKHLSKLYPVYDLEYNAKPIKVYIDSYGGHVYACLGLISVIENSKTPVHTICTGKAMSCGFLLLIHGHKRFSYKYSKIMAHQISGGLWGKLTDLEEDLREYKSLQKDLDSMIIRKTSISKKQLSVNKKQKKDWFMKPKEAKKFGVIDEILN